MNVDPIIVVPILQTVEKIIYDIHGDSMCPNCATGACHELHCGAGIQLRRLSTCPRLCLSRASRSAL
eukprot:1020725-Amphidinium_carterae.1